ncbi:MAG: DUF4329 domain-containing protein [Pseudomonadota bacterium]
MRRITLAIFFLTAGCTETLPPPSTQDGAFHQAAIAFLDALQPRSIREEREYCGYFGRDAAGGFVATEPIQGAFAYCDLADPPNSFQTVASYHTHGSFDTDADSEVPSVADVESDIAVGVYGYVSTPGGRVWFINGWDDDIRQLCGISCVASDPAFIAGDAGPIPTHYTLAELIRREAF